MYHATRAATEAETTSTEKRANELEIVRDKRATEQRAMSPVAAIVISEETIYY
jgi:hypothetical protein